MKDIVNWLLEVEHLANVLYQSAYEYFIDDKKLNEFLRHTAEDEAWHYHVIGSAANYFQNHSFPISQILLDDETKSRIENTFRKNIQAVLNKTLTVEQLIDCMVETEFSEWNMFFLYVVNTLKIKKSEFEYAASEMQHHLSHIEHFIQNETRFPHKVEEFKKLTTLYQEKILVVEDDAVLAGLLELILANEGVVHLAGNGQEALDKMEQHFYKLIVSDIDMPIMDGLTFYREAVAKYPKLNEVFIFLTGDLSPERELFCKKSGLLCLQKPVSVKDIRRISSEIIYRMKK
ncbi:MAG: response regulator [Desulforhopalus sp.]